MWAIWHGGVSTGVFAEAQIAIYQSRFDGREHRCSKVLFAEQLVDGSGAYCGEETPLGIH
jgi:hypothetical protein